jgi:hypothetical protein
MLHYNTNTHKTRHDLTGFRKEAVDGLFHHSWGGLALVHSKTLSEATVLTIRQRLTSELIEHAATSKRQARWPLDFDLRKLFFDRREQLLIDAGDIGAIHRREKEEQRIRDLTRAKEIVAAMGFSKQTPSAILSRARLAYRGELQDRVKKEFKRLEGWSTKAERLPYQAAKNLTQEAEALATRVSPVRDAKDRIDSQILDALEAALAKIGGAA